MKLIEVCSAIHIMMIIKSLDNYMDTCKYIKYTRSQYNMYECRHRTYYDL